MRTLLLAGVAIASLAGASVEAAKAADVHPAPGYGAAPPYDPPAPIYGAPQTYAPPNYGPAPAYQPPPRYGSAPPPQQAYGPPPQQHYGPPPAVAYDDDEEYAPAPRLYRGPPVYAERPRYRDCWWQWGERHCEPRRGW